MLSTKLSHVTSPHALKGQMGRPHTPWARSFCPFRACGAYLRNLN